jgi:hypothetical protein
MTKLLETFTEELRARIPGQEFSINEEEYVVSIPARNADVGPIEIQGDEDELVVFVGNFTHWHAGCHEEALSEQEKARDIANQVVEFLEELFSDQIVMWGSHKYGGGFHRIKDKPNSKSWFGFGKLHKEWVWSGLYSS